MTLKSDPEPSPAAAERPLSHLFYQTRLRRPLVDRAEGIYLWTRDGRRFIDGSSGAMVTNIGHGNRAVLDAMKKQMERATFAYRLHFENEPADELARTLAGKLPEGTDRIFFVSGGSEATESCIKLARQWAVATGQGNRWKVISRFPSYHGGTLGALAVTGDDALTESFRPMMRAMPMIPAPTVWRDRDNLSMEERGLRYADLLEERILAEGAETVLAFIMEPVGGVATAALVAPDSYYPRIREICDRHGVLLIHDEVMSGAGRTGKFLGGDHWNCRPDLIALSKGLGSGYGIWADPENLVHMKRIADKLFGTDFTFSVLAAGRRQMEMVTIAAAMGGNVRVGLEDSLYDGRELARSNADQVRRIRTVLDSLSLEIATPAEARERLALKGGDRVRF